MLEMKSFDAIITEGRIQHEEDLRSLEGKEVQMIVQFRSDQQEPADDFDVENDVYVKMPVKTSIFRAATIRRRADSSHQERHRALGSA